MNDILEGKLHSDFPFMKRPVMGTDGTTVNNNYAFGCEVGDGWYELLNELCEKITDIYSHYGAEPDIVIDQVKEKYGGLRFYYHREGITEDETASIEINHQIEDIVQQFEDRSEYICEECGQEGILRDDLPWMATLCEHCYKNRRDTILKGGI